jgi:hypothetical protein
MPRLAGRVLELLASGRIAPADLGEAEFRLD